MRKRRFISIFVGLAFVAGFAVSAFAQQGKTPPATTKQDVVDAAKVASDKLAGATKDALLNDLKKADKDFDAWKKAVDAINKLREDAKSEADKAKSDAEAALAAAKVCDKAAYDAARMKATSHRANAESKKKSANDKEKAVLPKMDSLQNSINDIQNSVTNAENKAKLVKGGANVSNYAPMEAAAGNFQDLLADTEISAKMSVYRVGVKGLKDSLKDGNTDAAVIQEITDTNDLIKQADAAMKACPPKEKKEDTGYVPKAVTEIYASVNDRCGVNVCTQQIDSGWTEQELADAMKTQCSIVAKANGQTVTHCEGPPSLVGAIKAFAKAHNVSVCWVEENYCVIESPLTPERGRYTTPELPVIHLERGQ
jgi:hypothetical protein